MPNHYLARSMPLARCAAVLTALLLSACAGTIKQDTRVQGDVSKVEGVAQVVVQMSPDALRQQADNSQFSRDELGSFLRRKLEGKGLMAATATHRVDIVVTDIRVRSAFSAVMFGVLAGDDHVTGRVRVLDPSGKPLRSFEVNANYALGGIGGGQDGTRMNWLYDKFSELAATELEKLIAAPAVGAAATAPGAAATASPASASTAAVVLPTLSENAALRIDDVEAVPGLGERGRAVYRDWLTQKPPRAFVVADNGHWYGTWGIKPKDPMESSDPTARALKRCRDAGHAGCTVYAVDSRVMYSPRSTEAAR